MEGRGGYRKEQVHSETRTWNERLGEGEKCNVNVMYSHDI